LIIVDRWNLLVITVNFIKFDVILFILGTICLAEMSATTLEVGARHVGLSGTRVNTSKHLLADAQTNKRAQPPQIRIET
jgi:hypothetical protein